MENAARQTLEHPMTFETLGEGLRSFDGFALRDLARFRQRCREKLVTCLKSFHDAEGTGPSRIWFGCPARPRWSPWESRPAVLPSWLCQVLSRNNDTKKQVFVDPLPTPSNIRPEYLKALLSHDGCNFCLQVHAKNGPTFCAELESMLALARDKVHTPSFGSKVTENLPLPRCRYAMTRSLPQIQLTQVLGTRDTSNVTYDSASDVTSDIDFDAAFAVAFDAPSNSAKEEETQES